jgi:hypothetical protein
MKCDQVTLLLEDYLDRNLSDADRAAVAEHIKRCPSCGEELQFLKKYRKELQSYPAVRPPRDFLENIHRRIDAEKKGGIVRALFFPARIKIPLEAAALLALALTGVLIFKPFTSEYVAQERPDDALKKAEESKKKTGPAERDGKEPAMARNESDRADKDLYRQQDKGMRVASSNGSVDTESMAEKKTSKAEEVTTFISLNLMRITPSGPEGQRGSAIIAENIESEKESAADSRSMQASRKKDSAPAGSMSGMDVIADLARSLDGSLVQTMYDEKTKSYRSAVVEIPAKNYPQFLKGLQGTWSVQKLYPSSVPTRVERLRIRVNLVD